MIVPNKYKFLICLNIKDTCGFKDIINYADSNKICLINKLCSIILEDRMRL